MIKVLNLDNDILVTERINQVIMFSMLYATKIL